MRSSTGKPAATSRSSSSKPGAGKASSKPSSKSSSKPGSKPAKAPRLTSKEKSEKGSTKGSTKRTPPPSKTAPPLPPKSASKSAPSKSAPSKPAPAKKSAPQISKPKPPKIKVRVKDDEAPTRCGTVALIGRPNVGKSSLLNALLGQKIAATTHKPQTTRRTLRGVLTNGNTQVIFVDTPGLHDEQGGLFSFMLDEALDTAAGVDVIAFMIEVDRTAQAIDAADQEALARVMQRGRKTPVILVINKIDVLKDKASLLPVLQAWSATDAFAAYVPVSAHRGEGLDGLISALGALLPEAPFELPEDSLTDQSERDISAELIREKVMLELQQEIPYRTAVIVEHFDESRRDDPRKPLVHIAAVIVVEKDSHKSMVIGAGGQRIKAIGQRARKDLEHLLQCQVHLELFAKVEKDWTQSGAGLRKLGYVHAK